MPGPLSIPNGDPNLIFNRQAENMSGDRRVNTITGKTALKKGRIKHVRRK